MPTNPQYVLYWQVLWPPDHAVETYHTEEDALRRVSELQRDYGDLMRYCLVEGKVVAQFMKT